MEDLRYQVDLLGALNQKLSESERMYRNICEVSNRAFVYVQPLAQTVKTLGKWDDYFDFRPVTPSDMSRILDYIDENAREDARRLFYPEKEGKDDISFDIPLRDNSKWLEVHCNILKNDDGEVTDKIVTFRDVTKSHKYKDDLQYMAYYDFLTGLYNRNYFISQLTKFITKAQSEHTIVSVFLIDIDDFHKINDGMGILVGDEVVQAFGAYLKTLMDTNVIASRFDGDLFAFAIYDPVGSRTADSLYTKIKNHLKDPFVLSDGNEVIISVSVGVAEYPEASDNALSLVNSAEIVMLKAKEGGKNTIRYFDTKVLNEFIESVSVEKRLRTAVHDMNFTLNYQPQYNSDGRTLRGVEALIRWKDDEGVYVSPASFIPLAEKNGTIIPIGEWVLETAIATHMKWKKRFDVSFILSVNISSIQYRRSDFVSKVINVCRKYDMPFEELELEITESVFIDDFNNVIEKMDELRDYGIKVSVDDFGTGFSSLSYLKGLPINTLKIDKSFIDNVLSDKASNVITESIINISKRLGYETIAEGVETKEQFDYLNEIGCDNIQGYYLGRPIDEDAVSDLLLRLI